MTILASMLAQAEKTEETKFEWGWWVIGIIVIVVALVLIAFAASGLFSSDKSSTSSTTTTTLQQSTTTAPVTSPATTTTATQTTPQSSQVPPLPTGLLKQGTSGNEVKALQQAGGVKKRAAKLLNISFRSMRYRVDKYGLGNLSVDDDEDTQSNSEETSQTA